MTSPNVSAPVHLITFISLMKPALVGEDPSFCSTSIVNSALSQPSNELTFKATRFVLLHGFFHRLNIWVLIRELVGCIEVFYVRAVNLRTNLGQDRGIITCVG